MKVQVVLTATPAYLERLRVIVVMHLHGLRTTLLARLRSKAAAFPVGVGVVPGPVAVSGVALQRVGLTPLAHVGSVAGVAPSLAFPAVIAAAFDASYRHYAEYLTVLH